MQNLGVYAREAESNFSEGCIRSANHLHLTLATGKGPIADGMTGADMIAGQAMGTMGAPYWPMVCIQGDVVKRAHLGTTTTAIARIRHLEMLRTG